VSDAVPLDRDTLRELAAEIAAALPPPGALLDADGAARMLGLYNGDGKPLGSWVLAQARKDLIPHVRFGRYPRFDPEQLRAWAKARARGPVVDVEVGRGG
jgi:hypothetical protein